MEYERIREEIAQVIYSEYLAHKRINDAQDKYHARHTTDQILSIKGIRLEADNQNLPEISYFGESYDAADEAQQDMLNAGFVKCLPKTPRCNDYDLECFSEQGKAEFQSHSDD